MNRYDFIKNNVSIISIYAPERVDFKILEIKEFKTGFHRGFENAWEWKEDSIVRCRIKILNGTLNYYTGKKHVFNSKSKDLWIGKKWIDRRLKERKARNEKKPRVIRK